MGSSSSGRTSTIDGRRDQHLLTLPVRWLTHVWARELEVVDGQFVADAARAPGADGRLRLVVLAWDGQNPRLVERRLAPEEVGR